MTKFRVYQNVTTHAVYIDAETPVEALQKAKSIKREDWDEYEQSEDDVTYEVMPSE